MNRMGTWLSFVFFMACYCVGVAIVWLMMDYFTYEN